MVQYVNSFTCTTNEKSSEIILHFRQLSPTLDENGNVSGTNVENISEIIVTKQGAEALFNLLKDIVSKQ